LKIEIPYMKKNRAENFRSLEVDPINNEYYVTIPEWMINELSWYEDTELEIGVDGNQIIISEKS
jgi:antitoxin component of MazEF toxin-antitoxin module